MPRPRHLVAYEQFGQANPDNRLETLVAFALFVDGEKKWADEKNPPPTDDAYVAYYDASLASHHVDYTMQKAREILVKVSNDVVKEQQSEFLAKALAAYKEEARKGHRGFRCWGIVEATCGAIFWTAILIALSIALAWNNIDAIEYLKKAYPPASSTAH